MSLQKNDTLFQGTWCYLFWWRFTLYGQKHTTREENFRNWLTTTHSIQSTIKWTCKHYWLLQSSPLSFPQRYTEDRVLLCLWQSSSSLWHPRQHCPLSLCNWRFLNCSWFVHLSSTWPRPLSHYDAGVGIGWMSHYDFKVPSSGFTGVRAERSPSHSLDNCYFSGQSWHIRPVVHYSLIFVETLHTLLM